MTTSNEETDIVERLMAAHREEAESQFETVKDLETLYSEAAEVIIQLRESVEAMQRRVIKEIMQ
jgi:hypothetical protein